MGADRWDDDFYLQVARGAEHGPGRLAAGLTHPRPHGGRGRRSQIRWLLFRAVRPRSCCRPALIRAGSRSSDSVPR